MIYISTDLVYGVGAGRTGESTPSPETRLQPIENMRVKTVVMIYFR